MDVDFLVFRPFDELMDRYPAFAGYEGSKRQPVMQGVIASEPHGAWVRDMLSTYENRSFIKSDGSLDLTPNTAYFTDRLETQGFVPREGKGVGFHLLLDKLRISGLLEYWMSDVYHDVAAAELAKVDWSMQLKSAKAQYEKPIWLLKAKRRIMQLGSRLKQRVIFLLNKK